MCRAAQAPKLFFLRVLSGSHSCPLRAFWEGEEGSWGRVSDTTPQPPLFPT